MISPFGSGSPTHENRAALDGDMIAARDTRLLKNIPWSLGGAVGSILASSRNSRMSASSNVSSASTPPPGRCQPLT